MTKYYIKKGENKVHEATVPSGTTGITVKLNWGNTQSKLSLTPYDSEGTKIGTYYDEDDPESTDGKISLKIDSKNLKSGVWKFKVKGVSVLEKEDYTFSAFAHK